jgi:hypothetical protein
MRWVLGGVAVALCLAVPAASASEATERDEYVAKAESICKANVLANKRIFKGVREQVKTGKLKQASRHFFQAARAFAKAVRQLTAVPQPAADAARLTKWLGILGAEKTILEKIGRALAAEDKRKAVSYSGELSRNSNKANNAVLSFDFNYCRIEPSRFE